MNAPHREALRTGLFIAAFFAAAGVATAFLPLWLADRGVTASEIGQLLGLSAVVKLAAVPGWGAASDRVGRARPLLWLSAALATALTLLFPAAHGFPALLALVTLQSAAASALSPLADALTLALANAGRLHYGPTRAWGSASYMVATAAAGPLLTMAGTSALPLLLAAGYGTAACLAPFLPEPDGPVHVAARLRRSTGPALWRVRPFQLTVLASALVQGSHAAYYGFAALHWRRAGLADSAIGLLIAEGIIAEIALFVWGRRLVERIGPARLTGLAAAACALRWTALAWTTAVPALAVLQVLHAATFAFQHLSSMQVLGRTMPHGKAASAQALLAALGFSVPTGLLIWVSGLLYARTGGLVFLPMAVVGGSALLLVRPLGRALRPA